MSRDLGSWVLPQPIRTRQYVKIPMLLQYRNYLPFGYELDDEDKHWLKPIPFELDALYLAKKHVKKYTYKAVAAWLTKQTGRKISAEGLRRRLASERSYRSKITKYRQLAKWCYEALERAKHYETFVSRVEETKFFESDYYVNLKTEFDKTFGGDSPDSTK